MTNEIWQVEVNGQVYEADFEELKQWIADRALLPEDKVRKGGMRWTQAYRIPLLRKVFDGEEVVETKTPVSAPAETPEVETVGAATAPVSANVQSFNTQPAHTAANYQTHNYAPKKESAENVCYTHTDAPAAYVCKECANKFCKACPKSFGSVKICPVCGEMCETLGVMAEKKQKAVRYQKAVTEGFGFEDFGRAWTYPFKFWQSLGLGALFVAFLSFGGFYGNLMANMIVFGCIAQTIGQVAHGNLERNFMPDFNEFEIVDDVIKPFILSIGIWIVTWLPTVVLLIALMFNVLNSVSNPSDALNDKRENAEKTIEESPSTQILLGQSNANTAGKSDGEPFSDDDMNTLINGGTAEQEAATAQRVEEMIKSSRQIKVERQKADHELFYEMLEPALNAALPFIFLIGLSVLWGIFYSPMALTIAGYTRSFLQTINPMVGIDTMKRMGGTYFAAFAFVLVVQIVSFVLMVIVAIVTSPFEMPILGNLPAKFIGSMFMFYFALVTAFILGSALYKCSDRLGIQPE